MKRFFLFLALLATAMVYAQPYEVKDGTIVMTKIIETGLSIADAHDAAVTFFATSYGNSNETQRLNTEDHLIYSGRFTNLYTQFGGYWTVDYHHIIDVSIKDGRVRIQVICDDAYYRSTVNLDSYKYTIATSHPVVPKGKCVVSSRKILEEAFEAGIPRMEQLIIDFENALKKKTVEEDW